MSSKAIENARNGIKRDVFGIDGSFKISRGNGLSSILHKIEMDTSITDEEIHKLYNIWYNLAMMYARKKSSSLISYLESVRYEVADLLYYYKLTFSTVYKVDNSLLDWWFEKSKFMDCSPIEDYYQNTCGYLMEYNDVIYYLTKQSDCCVIRSLGDYEQETVLTYEYTRYDNDKGSNCTICCNNDSCPHYKSSVRPAYKDGTRDVFCSLDDLRKCNQCKRAGVAHPFDIEFLFEAVAYCLENRDTSRGTSEKRDDYEHLPVPERVDDVVIYFGKKKERKPLPFIRVDDIAVERSSIPNSHASPREHQRKNGSRRGTMRFNPKTGEKDIKVKGCDKVSDCIVNKGHTKTSYTFKERK